MLEQERAILSKRLFEAEEAYHKLQTGRSARVLVDQNGERVEFTAANHYRLSTYIQELKRLLGKTRVSGPLRVYL